MMINTPAWKEGRHGAVSLCYLNLTDPEFGWVLEHHAAVGIRASLVCDRADPQLALPAGRNWDLLAGGDDPGLISALTALDGRNERGGFRLEVEPAAPSDWVFTLSTQAEVIPGPEPDLSKPLPSFATPADVDLILDWIEAEVAKGRWLILRVDHACLREMGREAHQRLLQCLGDHHARIWCAPVRDIAVWRFL